MDIFNYIKYNQINFVKKYISNKENINIQNIRGETPIFIAAEIGNIEIVKLLLDAKCDSSISENGNNYTPMMIACYKHNNNILELLLEYDNHFDAIDKYGNTSLIISILHYNYSAAKILIDMMDINSLNIKNCLGRNFLHYLCKIGGGKLILNYVVNLKNE